MAESSQLPRRMPGMSGRIHGLSPENEDALRILHHDWRTRYLVTIGRVSGVLRWQASRIGTSATVSIEADTPEDLDRQIGEDDLTW